MLLRHSREPIDGQPVENTFVALDERSGELLGSSVIYVEHKPVLYPARPLLVRIQLDRNSVPDAILGATIARAKEICADSGEYARIYTHCDPDDDTLMEMLRPFGFRDNDGFVCMEIKLSARRRVKAPAGCTTVYDTLEDPIERKYFLERYNRLFGVNHDQSWLNQYIDRREFMRILSVAPTGMAGEVLIWREDDAGIIGFINTAKRWRHLGVASHLLSLAFDAFDSQNLYRAEAHVRVRYPHVLRLLESAGFQQTRLIMRYPGIDLNPEDV
ncbi:MAG: GNAT family N-acetyltransferase [Christensenellales bacterium]|nr:GNAT family N-acetyltransferase [Christensenellales bacterium]